MEIPFGQKAQLTARLHAFMLVQLTKMSPKGKKEVFGPALYFLNVFFFVFKSKDLTGIMLS